MNRRALGGEKMLASERLNTPVSISNLALVAVDSHVCEVTLPGLLTEKPQVWRQ
jgi:hypothetical protein